MAHASKIIETFGGTRAMASAIGLPPSTVQSWKDSGVIPAKRQQDVLDKARELGKELSPADFFDTPAPDGEAAA